MVADDASEVEARQEHCDGRWQPWWLATLAVYLYFMVVGQCKGSCLGQRDELIGVEALSYIRFEEETKHNRLIHERDCQ